MATASASIDNTTHALPHEVFSLFIKITPNYYIILESTIELNERQARKERKTWLYSVFCNAQMPDYSSDLVYRNSDITLGIDLPQYSMTAGEIGPHHIFMSLVINILQKRAHMVQ
jgi:hypothetical protein